MSSTKSDTLSVRIVTPEAVVWEGSARSVSSKNSAGPFDVLPDHANMVTLIEREPIVVDTDAGEHRFEFSKAVIYVRESTVSVYADITPAHDAEIQQATR